MCDVEEMLECVGVGVTAQGSTEVLACQVRLRCGTPFE